MCLKVDNEKKSAELMLSKAFYPKKAIDKAIKEIKGAEITKKDSKDYFHIVVKTENASAEELALEFCNLLLAIIKGSAI